MLDVKKFKGKTQDSRSDSEEDSDEDIDDVDIPSNPEYLNDAMKVVNDEDVKTLWSINLYSIPIRNYLLILS